jgi:hypothetical protein
MSSDGENVVGGRIGFFTTSLALGFTHHYAIVSRPSNTLKDGTTSLQFGGWAALQGEGAVWVRWSFS